MTHTTTQLSLKAACLWKEQTRGPRCPTPAEVPRSQGQRHKQEKQTRDCQGLGGGTGECCQVWGFFLG